MDTTAQTISWSLFYLAFMPEEQELLFREMEANLPENSFSSRLDRLKLLNFAAFLEESQRYATLVPHGFPRRCSESIKLANGQYSLPKNTSLVVCWYPNHFDPKFWHDPHNFRPGRWLDPLTGTFTSVNSHMLPFGIGRRGCPGEPIARNSAWTFVAAFIQHFRWTFDPSSPIPGFDDHCYRLLRTTPMHKLVFTLRS